MEEGEFLTSIEFEAIANRLAWTDGSLNERVEDEYGLEPDSLFQIMQREDYEWNFDLDVWASTRPIWTNGELDWLQRGDDGA